MTTTKKAESIVLGALIVTVLVGAIWLLSNPYLWDISEVKTNGRQVTVMRLLKFQGFIYRYAAKMDEYPSEENWQEDLRLYFRVEFDGVPFPERWLTDGWGNEFRYRNPAAHKSCTHRFNIYSVGENGIDENGEGDDLGNWRESWPDDPSIFEMFEITR